MGNELVENENILSEGQDVNVIAKRLSPKASAFTKMIPALMWLVPIIVGVSVIFVAMKKMQGNEMIAVIIIGIVVAILPGIIFGINMEKAKEHLQRLQQKINNAASQIDNYLEQRVVILENAAKLVSTSVNLDKEVFSNLAKFRSNHSDTDRNEKSTAIEKASRSINVAMENYPELKAHEVIKDAMLQNSNLQREITAARDLYNDTIYQWNAKIYEWPIYLLVASKNGYTTRIPFIADSATKQRAREVFF